jgi:hypothetical protein
MKLSQLLVCGILLAPFISLQTNARVDIEIDPATYAFKGDSLHIKFTQEGAPQWRWGLGTYSLEMPDALVDVNSKNKQQDWTVDIDRAYGVFAEYYLDASQTGWFVGGQVSQQTFTVENPLVSKTEFSNGLLMLNAGYKWPLKNTAFYLLPWAGVGYTKTIDKNNARAASGFDVDPVTAFMSVHLGYAF